MYNLMAFFCLVEWFGECAFEESITFSTTTKELTHSVGSLTGSHTSIFTNHCTSSRNASWRCTGTFLGPCFAGTASGFNLNLTSWEFTKTLEGICICSFYLSCNSGKFTRENEWLLEPTIEELPVSLGLVICWMLAQFI